MSSKNSQPVAFQKGKDKNGEWALANVVYVAPKTLRDFQFLKGMWVPTEEVGTHGAFACWFPLRGLGGCYVWGSEKRCKLVCSGDDIPMQITEDYPLIAMLPMAFDPK